MTNTEIESVIRSVRPALRAGNLSERDRAAFLYNLIREVHSHVKFDVNDSDTMTPERDRIGKIADLANPANRRDA